MRVKHLAINNFRMTWSSRMNAVMVFWVNKGDKRK